MHIPIKRSATNKVFAGVLGGIAEKYDWSANILRLIFVIFTVTPIFPGILVYLILLLLMEKPDSKSNGRKNVN